MPGSDPGGEWVIISVHGCRAPAVAAAALPLPSQTPVQRLEIMLSSLLEMHRQGRLDDVVQGCRTLLETEPENVDAMHLLAVVRHRAGEHGEAMQLAQRAHQLQPENSQVLVLLATLQAESGDQAQARSSYQKALDNDPNTAAAHSGLGYIALQQDKLEQAEEYFRTALRTEDTVQAQIGLGTVLLRRGDADQALKLFSAAAEQAPQDARLQGLLGEAFFRKDMPAFAEQAFSNSLSLDDGLHSIRQQLGVLLLQQREPARAAKEFARLAQVEGFEVVASLGQADAARMARQNEAAVEHYRDALKRRPRLVQAAASLATCLDLLGRTREALEVCDDWLSERPEDRRFRAIRAHLLARADRLDDAIGEWQALYDEQPKDLEAAARLAMLHEQLGNYDKAAAIAAQAQQGELGHGELTLLAARCALRDGKPDQARAELQEMGGQQLDAAMASRAWQLLGLIDDQRGDRAAAVAHFQSAQQGMERVWKPWQGPDEVLRARLQDQGAVVDQPELPQPPVFLLGTPGSGVERIAALLADQPGVTLLQDRLTSTPREDDFSRPRFELYREGIDTEAAQAARQRYLDALPPLAPGSQVLVDWMPLWDANWLPLLRAAFPDARLVVVSRDPRDALLNWLAFGWGRDFPCNDVMAATLWLHSALQHLDLTTAQDRPQHLVVNPDELLDDPAGAGAALAAFMGLGPLQPGPRLAGIEHGGGLPVRFGSGHWRAYAEVLAEPFARLLLQDGEAGGTPDEETPDETTQ